jgi:hypothetical protein
MDKRVVAITTSAALMLLYAASGARAQMQQPSEQQPSEQQQQTEQGGEMGSGEMGSGGMMRRGMMRRGLMGRGMMRRAGMPLRIIFALMDADGDGTISLQEWQEAHERIFKAMNTTHDGRLTMDQIRAFMTGQTGASQQGPQQ